MALKPVALRDVRQQTRCADKLSIDAIIRAIITSDDAVRVTHCVIPSAQASIRHGQMTAGRLELAGAVFGIWAGLDFVGPGRARFLARPITWQTILCETLWNIRDEQYMPNGCLLLLLLSSFSTVRNGKR